MSRCAQRIERRFPDLGDRLSSTVEFLRATGRRSAGRLGRLRRAVIVETNRSGRASSNLDEVLERRPTRRRRVRLAAAICWRRSRWCCSTLASARLALARLARPFGNDAWPQANNLGFRARRTDRCRPDVRGRSRRPTEHVCPTTCGFTTATTTTAWYTEEVEPMQMLDGVMVARGERHAPVQYRAEGGDDQSMPWTRLEVVEPPRIESLKVSSSAGLHRLAANRAIEQHPGAARHARGDDRPRRPSRSRPRRCTEDGDQRQSKLVCAPTDTASRLPAIPTSRWSSTARDVLVRAWTDSRV